MESDSTNSWTPEEIRDFAVQRWCHLAPAKYNKGQREHGGLITDRALLEAAEEETIDLWFYLQGLRIKLDGIKRQLEAEKKKEDL